MDSWISYVADILSSFYNESLWSFCSFIENMTLRSLTANTETSIVKQLTHVKQCNNLLTPSRCSYSASVL